MVTVIDGWVHLRYQLLSSASSVTVVVGQMYAIDGHNCCVVKVIGSHRRDETAAVACASSRDTGPCTYQCITTQLC